MYSGTENAEFSHVVIAMGRKVEKFSQFKIEWISVPEISGCGHGVEFHYRTGDHGKHSYNSREDGRIIGFIEGFGWLDKQGSPIKVYFLSSDSKEWGELLSRAGEILNSLKECVFIVLEERIEPGQIWHGKNHKSQYFYLLELLETLGTGSYFFKITGSLFGLTFDSKK